MLGTVLAATVALACHGHTALTWDPYPDATVPYFEVQRTVSGMGAWSVAGDTREKNRGAFVDNGISFPAVRAERWDLLRAWSLPLAGVSYDYRVVAVGGNGVRSAPSNVVNCGPQDPTSCYPVRCP